MVEDDKNREYKVDFFYLIINVLIKVDCMDCQVKHT